MATWTKTNTTITLLDDTNISELINAETNNLVNGDTINVNGHKLTVDIITCGVADEDYAGTEVDIGVTILNDNTHCNLEFKDLSGIRLNKTLPATVHPWVDPDHPLPVKLSNDDPRIIHGDPYCTKLTANARVEIQLAGNFSLGGGEANLPTKTREGYFYARTAESPTTNSLTFNREFPLHFGDMIICLSGGYTNMERAIINDLISNTIYLKTLSHRQVNYLWGLCAGGVIINRLYTGSSTVAYINQNVKAGTLILYSAQTTRNGNIGCQSCSIIADRLIYIPSSETGTGAHRLFTNANAKINEVVCTKLLPCGSGNHTTFGINRVKINDIATFMIGYYSMTNETVCSQCFLKINKGEIVDAGGIGGAATILFGDNVNGSMSRFGESIEWNFTKNNIIHLSSGTIEKSSTSWHHKPKDTSSTTWRYEDRIISPHKSLHLKISRLVESTSSLSEARVAITDTANWYPETKFGAYANIVINNIETDKWQIYNLKYKNESDEPQQVRVWECVSGSTDGGYLKVEEATGGPM